MKVESHIRKRRLIWHRIFLSLILVGVISCAIYFTHSKSFQITAIHAQGATTIANNILEESIKSELTGAYLGLFPENNIFTYPKNKLEQKLKSDYPAIAKISMSANLSGDLEVKITEHSQAYFLCHADLDCEKVVTDLGNMNLNIQEVSFDTGIAKITLNSGWALLYATSTSPADIISRLSTALNSEALKNRDLNTLEYLDLRFGNKIFYKFK